MSRLTAKIPEPVLCSYEPCQITKPGNWLVISDIHVPYHDVRTIELAIHDARKAKASGLLINGDLLDSHELSTYDKDPGAPRYQEEIDLAKMLLRYMRQQLPNARMVYKAGNHEERLSRYLMRQAPALFGLEGVTIPFLLDLPSFKIDFVGDKRVIRLGKLNVLHGHEYRPPVTAPVNPARGMFLRAKAPIMTGHFHQTSEHHEPTITGKPQGAWSVGCACQLSPAYSPLNKWNLGYALVKINNKEGDFSVRNMRVADGKVV